MIDLFSKNGRLHFLTITLDFLMPFFVEILKLEEHFMKDSFLKLGESRFVGGVVYDVVTKVFTVAEFGDAGFLKEQVRSGDLIQTN